jgi:hypothetical protein
VTLGSWFVLLKKLDYSTLMMMFPLRAAVGVRFLVAALPLHGVGALLIGRKR